MKTEKVRVEDIIPGPIRHPVLAPELIERIRAFKEVLGDVEQCPIETTIENFQRDMHPEREVEVWERIARAYKDFITEHTITEFRTRCDVLEVLLTGGDDFDHPSALTVEQIAELKTS